MFRSLFAMLFVSLFFTACGENRVATQSEPTPDQLQIQRLAEDCNALDKALGIDTSALVPQKRVEELESKSGFAIDLDSGAMLQTVRQLCELYDVKTGRGGIVGAVGALEKAAGLKFNNDAGLVLRMEKIREAYEHLPLQTRLQMRTNRLQKKIK